MTRKGATGMKKYLSLAWTMFKIGLFTFGGGYAMLSLLEHEFVEKKNWITAEEFLDMVALAESTPGPIAINSATYLGYKRGGALGSTIATISVCIPSFAIIYLISLFFDRFLTLPFVRSAFRGIQACVVFLILSAGVKMLKKIKKTPISLSLVVLVAASLVTLSLLSVRFSSVFYVLIGAVVGLSVYLVSRLREKKGGRDA